MRLVTGRRGLRRVDQTVDLRQPQSKPPAASTGGFAAALSDSVHHQTRLTPALSILKVMSGLQAEAPCKRSGREPILSAAL